MAIRMLKVLGLFLALHGYCLNPIVVVSIDGLRPDAIEKANATTLMRLINEGTSFSHATTVRPSLTLPAHTSMLTGLDPDQHGIFWDEYLPSYGPVRFKTALEIAHEHGFTTALIVAKEKLLHLNRPNSVDYFERTDKEGAQVALAFERYVSFSGLPNVTFLHLPDPDTKGHKHMWMSKAYLAGVRNADFALTSIINTANAASIERPIIIVTADHGGFGFGHMADIDANNDIPFIAIGDNIAQGLIKQDRVTNYDIAPTILSLLGLDIPEDWAGKPAPITINTSDTIMPMSLGKALFSSPYQANMSF